MYIDTKVLKKHHHPVIMITENIGTELQTTTAIPEEKNKNTVIPAAVYVNKGGK